MNFQTRQETDGLSPEILTNSGFDPGLVIRLIFVKYSAEATPVDKKRVAQMFFELQNSKRNDTHQPYIKYVYGGTQNSLTELNKGFEEGYTIGFQSGGDRNYFDGMYYDNGYYDQSYYDLTQYLKDNNLLDDYIVFDYKSFFGD